MRATHQGSSSLSRNELSFTVLKAAIDDKLGTFDIPCPICNPHRRKRHLRCLRVWRTELNFVTFNCAHCEAHGFAHAGLAKAISPSNLKKLKAEAFEYNVNHRLLRRRSARWLWLRTKPIQGTLAERYLRSRGITCQLPHTLRFLPAWGRYAPAMLAAFGIPAEDEPGRLNVSSMAVHDLHITRLRPDGMAKAEIDNPKIMLAASSGLPIVCAAVNDGGGLVICEGIEDALSIHQATGLGAWAAGSAGRLSGLARSVPLYVESVTVSIDDDDTGRRHGSQLARDLRRIRGGRIEVFMHEAKTRAAS
jgi:hypothetical protein